MDSGGLLPLSKGLTIMDIETYLRQTFVNERQGRDEILPYDAGTIEIMKLDGDNVVYRHIVDDHTGKWVVSTIEGVIKAVRLMRKLSTLAK